MLIVLVLSVPNLVSRAGLDGMFEGGFSRILLGAHFWAKSGCDKGEKDWSESSLKTFFSWHQDCGKCAPKVLEFPFQTLLEVFSIAQYVPFLIFFCYVLGGTFRLNG